MTIPALRCYTPCNVLKGMKTSTWFMKKRSMPVNPVWSFISGMKAQPETLDTTLVIEEMMPFEPGAIRIERNPADNHL